MNRNIRRIVLLGLGCAALTGCGSSGGVSHSDVRYNLTPELKDLNQRPVEYWDKPFVAWDSNWRAAWGDFARGALIDRPSRLAPVPITH